MSQVKNIFNILLFYKFNYIVSYRLLQLAIKKIFLFAYLWTFVKNFGEKLLTNKVIKKDHDYNLHLNKKKQFLLHSQEQFSLIYTDLSF